MTHEVSEDEIWNGLRRRFAVGERLVSKPGQWHAPNLGQSVVVRRSTRLRSAGAGSIVAVGAAIILVAVLFGPLSARPGLVPTPSATVPASAATPTATPAPSEALTLTADDAGVSLSASLDRTTVEPGGTVTITVTVHNGRATPAGYNALCAGSAIMTTSLPLPLEPTGLSWTGAKAAFKAAALGGTAVTGESDNSIVSAAYSATCSPGDAYRTLSPGETIESRIVWPASLVKGVPALPGDVPFTITFMGLPGYPTAFPTRPPGPLGLMIWAPDPSMLHVSGHIEIVGQAPKLLSKGQAIDAALANPQFASWLGEEPSSTWSIINVVLQDDGPTAYMPAGPSWLIEVFRERGVPRNSVLAFIDPYTGALQMNTCESPCSR
ncbi:MAG TPA: hypothetical protein VF361_07430 [Candidatus Limnocylindrales bacterium]